MKQFIQQEFSRITSQKLMYPLRLYLQSLGLLVLLQGAVSLVISVFRTGEISVVWHANWLLASSFVIWLIYLIVVVRIGSKSV